MAQWNKNEQDYLNQERSLFEVNMIATKDGSPVSLSNPFPVSLGSSNITIIGDITIPGIVTVTSTANNPIHNHITEVGTSDTLNVPYLPVGVGTVNLNLSYLPVGISSLLNTVSISNTSFAVNGTVSISNTSFYVTGVGGSVSVSNTSFAVNGPVSISNTSFAVNGPVSVSNTSFAVNGPVSISNTSFAVNGPVSISNTSFAVNGPVSVSNTSFAVNGPVSVSNTSFAVNGPVSVSNTSFAVSSIASTVTVEVNVNNTPVSSSNPLPVTGSISIANSEGNPTLVKYADDTNIQLDTQERLRIALQGQQWWYVPSTDKDGDLRYIESFVGTGATSVFVQNLAQVNLTTGIGTTSSAIRASRRRHKTRPGVSHQYYASHNFDGPQKNAVKRRGMFTNFNGMFFEFEEDLSLVVRRRLLDGTLAEERLTRGSWNGDNLDGNGISGINTTTYDKSTQITSRVSISTVTVAGGTNSNVWRVGYAVTNPNAFKIGTKVTVTGITSTSYDGVAMITGIGATTITATYVTNPGTGTYTGVDVNAKMSQTFWHHQQSVFFDFNGSRNTKIRFGMHTKKGPTILHIFDFTASLGSAYQNAPALMERTEIVNTGTVSYLPSFSTGGVAYNVEAELELNPGFGVATNNNYLLYPKNATDEFAIVGVGLRAGEPYQRADIQLQSIQIVDIANINPQNGGVCYWRLLLNPTLGGTGITTTNTGKATRAFSYTTGTTFSGGVELLSGYSTQAIPIDVRTSLNFINLGSNIEYTDADKIVLVVKQLAGGVADARLVATMNYIESL